MKFKFHEGSCGILFLGGAHNIRADLVKVLQDYLHLSTNLHFSMSLLHIMFFVFV